MYLQTFSQRTPGPHGFSGEFYQMVRKALIPIPHKLFLKKEMEGTLPNSFCEASIMLIPKSEKDITEEKKTREMRNQPLKN